MKRSPGLLAVLTLLLVIAAPAVAQDPPTSEIPATPVGVQLEWVLAQINGDAVDLTEDGIAEHFSERVLTTALPAPALLNQLRQATELAPVTFAGFAFPPTETRAVALIEANGQQAAIYLAVKPEPPHRITRLDLGERPAAPSASGERVAIGDRSLYLDCVGEGAPTVVLEGGIVDDWAMVQPDVATFTRVCAYDRPDTPGSRSDPTPERTAQEVVDDLHALLGAAGETGPYVLVGHAMGGLNAQLYAYWYPDDVAGLVLVNPTPEEFSVRLAAMITALGTPASVPSPDESIDEMSFQQMREARASGELPPVPLIVLTHGRAEDPAERPPGWPMEEEERIFRELHAEIAALLPDSRHIIAEESGRDIPQDQPDLVINAILQVVAAARDPGTWTTSVAGPVT